jgi:ubiquitin conjugation factor E4 B
LSDQENIPDEFLDPILFNVMVDPVRLPASQMVVDRSTIQAHLLNDPHDPFNRQVLTIEQVEPMPELKAQIEAFIKSSQLK